MCVPQVDIRSVRLQIIIEAYGGVREVNLSATTYEVWNINQNYCGQTSKNKYRADVRRQHMSPRDSDIRDINRIVETYKINKVPN